MSWKPEFLVDGKWYPNAVAFATEQEAKDNARDKFMVWTMPTDWRAVESTDPVNYRYVSGMLVPFVGETAPEKCPWCGCETRLQPGKWDGHKRTCPMRPADEGA